MAYGLSYGVINDVDSIIGVVNDGEVIMECRCPNPHIYGHQPNCSMSGFPLQERYGMPYQSNGASSMSSYAWMIYTPATKDGEAPVLVVTSHDAATAIYLAAKNPGSRIGKLIDGVTFTEAVANWERDNLPADNTDKRSKKLAEFLEENNYTSDEIARILEGK